MSGSAFFWFPLVLSAGLLVALILVLRRLYSLQVAGRVEPLKAWSVGSDRDVRIRGRHSRRFYGFADQLLRSEVELEHTRRKSGIEAAVIADLQNKVADLRTGLHASSAEVEA